MQAASLEEAVQELGADQAIDHEKEAFEQPLKDFDAVFETVGGDTMEKSFKVLKKDGTLVSMLGQSNAALAQQHGVSAIGQMIYVNCPILIDGKIIRRTTVTLEPKDVEAARPPFPRVALSFDAVFLSRLQFVWASLWHIVLLAFCPAL